MPYGRYSRYARPRRRTTRRSPARRSTRTSSRSRTTRRRSVARPQTLRIVVEQPQMAPARELLGLKPAPAPRKGRF